METHKQDKDPFKWSDYVLHLARWYIYAAAAMLVLYLILATMENHKTTIVVTRSYRVPIEREEEVPLGTGGQDT